MKNIMLSALALGGLIWSQAAAADETADPAKLIGAYQIVSGSRDGQELGKDRLQDMSMRIAANAITTFDKDKKEVYAATYDIDSSRQPWRISMTAKVTPANGTGAKSSGLIEMTGDTVKLIYALPGGAVPTDFKTGEKQQMFVLKKVEN